MEDDQPADIGWPLQSGEGTGRYQGSDYDNDTGEDSLLVFQKPSKRWFAGGCLKTEVKVLGYRSVKWK